VVRRYDTIDVFAARVSGLVGWLRIIRDFFLQTFSSFKPLRRSLQFLPIRSSAFTRDILRKNTFTSCSPVWRARRGDTADEKTERISYDGI
jgi:hypothetical protein